MSPPRLHSQAPPQRPRRIGAILDHSFHLLPRVFSPLFVAYLIYGAVALIFQHATVTISLGLVLLSGILMAVISVFMLFACPLLAHRALLGNPVTLQAVIQKVNFLLLFRTLGMFIWVTFITIAGMFLFIIPGLVYAINRCLSFYALLFDDLSADDAILKSKRLMTAEPWYRLTGPWARVGAISVVVFILNIVPGVLESFINDSLRTGSLQHSLLYIFNVTLQGVTAVYASLCFTAFYHDLVARYDATDILAGIEGFTSDSTAP